MEHVKYLLIAQVTVRLLERSRCGTGIVAGEFRQTSWWTSRVIELVSCDVLACRFGVSHVAGLRLALDAICRMLALHLQLALELPHCTVALCPASCFVCPGRHT